MSIAPLAAGRHFIRGSRLTTQNVEEGFRLEGPGQAAAGSPKGSPAGVRRRPVDDAPAHHQGPPQPLGGDAAREPEAQVPRE